MDFFEDLGGCAMIAIAGAVILILTACVVVVVLGGAIPDLTG
jgi:hypothetical protein